MKHKNIIEGVFVSRQNRFCAFVTVDGVCRTVHVKNTGRLKELLVPGARVFLSSSDNEKRKTKYDLVSVEKNGRLVSIDSQAANDIAAEWLEKTEYFGKDAIIRREVFFGNSRFDFHIKTAQGKEIFLEVKGCTLERNGTALFPDAPTERGVKHIKELCDCLEKGYGAYILFVIQMKGVRCFSPNDECHREFGEVLRDAFKKGVKIIAVDCEVKENETKADCMVDVVL